MESPYEGHRGALIVIDIQLYGALAGVAAITTALLAAVALQPLSALTSARQRKRGKTMADAAYKDAQSDANRAAWTALWLNIPACVVNAAVLASWARVAVVKSEPDEWEYWLPWLAVTLATVFLVIVALVTILKLRRVAKK